MLSKSRTLLGNFLQVIMLTSLRTELAHADGWHRSTILQPIIVRSFNDQPLQVSLHSSIKRPFGSQ